MTPRKPKPRRATQPRTWAEIAPAYRSGILKSMREWARDVDDQCMPLTAHQIRLAILVLRAAAKTRRRK